MTNPLTPRHILDTLLPHLRVAAGYTRQIQSKITALPEKEDSGNFFAAALTAADLSVQTFVEVALLGTFPNLRFHGEEYEKSFNTDYFRAIDLGPQGDYLVTLDPIDGTQFYLDGHSNYQIILSILNWDEFEAVLAISPAQDRYYYALRGQGAFQGAIATDLDDCQSLTVEHPQSVVHLGWGLESLAPRLEDRYHVNKVATDYSHEVQISNVNGLLSGDLTGAILQRGKFIDGGALAFLAQEMGFIVTCWDGSPLPALHTCDNYERPGLVIASSESVHQHLLEAVR